MHDAARMGQQMRLSPKANLAAIVLGLTLLALTAPDPNGGNAFRRSSVPMLAPRSNPAGVSLPTASLAAVVRPEATTGSAWTFIGPLPIKNEFVNNPSLPPPLTTATGRTSTLAADLQSRGRLFVGEASGGLWRSTDGGVSFTPIFDSGPTTAMGSIALDPVNSTPTTIYLATGEGNHGDSLYGQGIFRSTDLGQTWTPLTAGAFAHSGFTKLEIDTSHNPPFLYAGVTFAEVLSRTAKGRPLSDTAIDGLWRSTDGGVTWKQYSAATFGDCTLADGPCPAQEVIVDRAAPNRVYASIENSGVYVSTDSGVTWSKAALGGMDTGQRTSLALAPSDPATIYAMAGDAKGTAYNGFFRSTDFGVSWSAGKVPTVTVAGTAYDGTTSGAFSQSNYDQALVVSPANSSHVFFFGVMPYASTDGGETWHALQAANGTHTDHHAAAFDPFDADILYWGNDGGAYSYQVSKDSFSALNVSLSGTQPYAIGPHPWNNNQLIAGLQDNDVQLYGGNLPWTDVSQPGDGGVSLFDQVNPSQAYSTFTDGTIQASSDGGMTWDITEPTNALAAALTAAHQAKVPFLSPLAVDPSVSGRVLFGALSVFVSTDHMQSWTPQTSQDLTNGGAGIYDVEFAPSDHSRAFTVAATPPNFAIYSTRAADLDFGASWTDVSHNLAAVTGAPRNDTAIPTSVAISSNPDVVYVTFGGFTADSGIGHIYRSTDFGGTWVRRDGNRGPAPLPDEPALRLLVDRTDSTGSTLLAASASGVFRSSDGGATWSAFDAIAGGGSFPKVPVFDLQQNFNGVIYAGTHGRGVYMLTSTALGGSINSSIVNSSGVTGQSGVNAGQFTITNSSGFPEAIGSVFVHQSGEVFSSLTLAAKIGSSASQNANTVVLSPTAVFVFNPPVSIPDGATGTFNLTGTTGSVTFRTMTASVAGGMSGAFAAILFVPALIGIAMLPLGGIRRRVAMLLLIALLLAAAQVGCGGGGNNGVRIAGQSTQTLTAVNGAIDGGAASFGGLPATLSHVALVF
jgi:hypothetical protein